MKCKHCGANIKKQKGFCEQCGRSLKNQHSKAYIVCIIAICVVLIAAAGAIAFYILKDDFSDSKYEKQLTLGNKYLEELNYEDAIIAYRDAISIEPKNEKAYVALADIYFELNEPENAEEILNEGYEATKSNILQDKLLENREKVLMHDTFTEIEDESMETSYTLTEESEPPALSAENTEYYYRDGFLRVGEDIFVNTGGTLTSYHDNEVNVLVDEINPAKSWSYDLIHSNSIYYDDDWLYYGAGTEIRRIKPNGKQQELVYDTGTDFELLGVCETYVYFSTEIEGGIPEYQLHIYNSDTDVEILAEGMAVGGPFKIVEGRVYTQRGHIFNMGNTMLTSMNLDGSDIVTLPMDPAEFEIYNGYIYAFASEEDAQYHLIKSDLNGNQVSDLFSGIYEHAVYIGETYAILAKKTDKNASKYDSSGGYTLTFVEYANKNVVDIGTTMSGDDIYKKYTREYNSKLYLTLNNNYIEIDKNGDQRILLSEANCYGLFYDQNVLFYEKFPDNAENREDFKIIRRELEEDNTQISSAETNPYACVYIEDMIPIASDHYTGNEGDTFIDKIGTRNGFIDHTGIEYEHGIEIWLARWNYEEEVSWIWNEYEIPNGYTRLKGVLTLLEDSRNIDNFDTTIKILGDGEVLYSALLIPGFLPEDIDINIAGISILTISAEDNSARSSGTSFLLGDARIE